MADQKLRQGEMASIPEAGPGSMALPCPFCGCPTVQAWHEDVNCLSEAGVGQVVTLYTFSCSWCGAQGGGRPDADSALRAWNDRGKQSRPAVLGKLTS